MPFAVSTALATYAAGERTRRSTLLALHVLQTARLLVPVVSVLGEVAYDEDGHAHDKTSDMAAVLLEGADGRLALLAFTGVEPMQRWDPTARPVPVDVTRAAQAAVQDRAEALVVDVAGPVPFVVEGADLRRLAEGLRLVSVGEGHGWVAG